MTVPKTGKYAKRQYQIKLCDFVTEKVLYCGILSTSKVNEDMQLSERKQRFIKRRI